MGSVIDEEEVGEAIRALGSLFKLTQVHLWDDGSTDTRLGPLFHEQDGILPNKSVDDTSNDLSGIANNRSAEMGLIKDMKALGLPVSFQTNKEWKNRTRGHQKRRIKNPSDEGEDKELASTLNFVSGLSSASYLKISDHANGDEEVDRPHPGNGCVQSNADEDESNSTVRNCCLGNADGNSQFTSETTDTQSYQLGENHDSDEWKVYWDSFYGRSYFYNFKTQESTWQPPIGMEHLAYSYETHNLTEFSIEKTEKQPDDIPAEKSDDLGEVCQSQCESLEEVSSLIDIDQETSIENQILDFTTLEEEGDCTYVANSIKKAKKKTRRTRAKKIFSSSETECFEILGKYWCQRYLLFSRFDEGIKMDEEGWFSVTPESIAKHHATRCNRGVVIDCFTGVGGNALQFASRSHHVIAIDLDPKRLELAKHNAAIYGVADKIDFVKGDFFDLAHNLKAGTVFLSPPWGGPDYVKASMYDMKTMLKPRDGDALFKAAANIAPTIIMFLPRNVDINQLAELALTTSPPWSLEVEENFLNGKLKAITAYFFRQDGC